MTSSGDHSDPLFRLTKAQLVDELQRLRRSSGDRTGEDQGESIEGGLTAAWDLLPTPVLVARKADLLVVHANGPAKALFDSSAANSLERPIFEILGQKCEWEGLLEGRAPGEGAMEMVLATPAAGEAGLHFLVSHRHLEFRGEPCLLVALTDNTHHHRAEDRLQRDLRRLQAVLDTVPNWLFVKDREGRYTMVNRSMARDLDGVPEDFIGKTYAESSLAPKHPHVLSSIEGDQKVLHENRPSDVREMKVLHEDGSYHHRQVTKLPIHDETGKIIGLVGISEDVTARHRHEIELRDSEVRFRNMVEGSVQGVLIRNQDRLLFANRALADIFGFESPEEMIALENIDGLVAPEDRERMNRYAADRFEGRDAPSLYNFQGVRKDGRRIWLDVTARPVEWEGGKAVQITNVDITERMEAERELRESRALLQTVFDTIPVWLHVKDTDSRFRLINRKMAQDIGVAPEEMIARSNDQAPHGNPVQREIIRRNDLQVLESGRMLEIEETVTMPNGELRVNRVYKVPLRNEDGQIVGIMGTSEDITARKRAEEALKEHEERFRNIVDHSPSAITLKDPEGRYQLVNRRFCEWVGLPPEEVIGKISLEFFKHEEAEILAKQDRHVGATGEQGEYEFDLNLADGKRHRVISTKFPVYDYEGKISGVGTITTDVTEQRATEQHLRQTQRLEALGTLAGGIAHDLNNILFPIIGYSEVLLKQFKHDPPTQSFLEIISSSAMRAKDLVSQILLFSRSSEGRREPCMLDPVAKEVVKLIRSTVSRSIQIDYRSDPNLPLVLADPSQIHQIMMNLCINASQAMPQGGTLSIALEKIELKEQESYTGRKLNGPHVRFVCEDSGVGMNQETLEHIFEPFFSTKVAGKGTGLGLATVYGVIQQHEGDLRVESDPGKGTRFEVYFPAVEIDFESHITIQDDVKGGSESILFVDDETTITTFAKLALEEIGYSVTALNDPHAALEAFRQEPKRYDLVITDQSMPNLTGDRLAVEMHKLNPATPIILATGNSESIDPRALRNFGITDFLFKPLGTDELIRFIRDVLDRRQET